MDRYADTTGYDNQKWFCMRCGKLNASTAKFCTGCGTMRTIYTPERDTGYVSRDTGMYEMQGADVVQEPKKGSAIKIIALVLGCILVAAGIGFGVSHFILNSSDRAASGEEASGTEDVISGDAGVFDDNSGDESSELGQENVPVDGFVIGETYTVVTTDGVAVRSTPEALPERKNQLKREQLPAEYYSQSQDGSYACLVKGAKVVCLEMEGKWMRITDGGWVCTETPEEVLIK